MGQQKTVTIKGIIYDIESGKALGDAVPVHAIKKFHAHAPAHHAVISDVAPLKHPTVAKTHAAMAAKAQPRVVKPSQVLKQEAIADAMQRAESHSRKQHVTKKPVGRLKRAARVAAVSVGALALGGYVTYANMAAITTRIAASQAGIRASYPSYTPTGYQLNGPVAFNNGMVSMKFGANAAPVAYTIDQERSSWDSSAVLANFVEPKAGTAYSTAETNGLTIYTFGQNAAWVNGGILYTITGNAPLSADQIQHIATSL